MTVHVDSWVRASIKLKAHIDAGGRAFFDGKEVEVVIIGGVRKVALPICKFLFTFDELKQLGAKVDVITLKTLAVQGAEGRWRENIQQRMNRDIPSNVYIANARSIEYAISKGKVPPPVRWIGRRGDKMTDTYDTIDEVVDAMAADKWRTEFRRGGRAKRKK